MGGIATEIKKLGAGAVDLVLPPRCPACREIVTQDGNFCADCFATLGFITDPACASCGLPFDVDAGDEALCGDCAANPKPYVRARAAFRYDGAIVPLLLGFKHGGRTHLAKLLAAQMRRLMPEAGEVDVLVPVPLDRRRLFKRGYNQAGMIALALGRATDVPVAVDGLVRVKPTASTAGLSRAGRFRAAQGAFKAEGSRFAGQRVVLVDDVMTTGATAEAASRALIRGGAEAVVVLIAARAVRTD